MIEDNIINLIAAKIVYDFPPKREEPATMSLNEELEAITQKVVEQYNEVENGKS